MIISTGPRRYREYLFASMARHYRIHLVNTVAPTWELPYLVGHSVVESTDVDLLRAAVAEVAAATAIDGVMSWDEARVHQAAVIAGELRLPTTPAEAVWRCRDKHQSRTALAAADLPQPRFALVGTASEAADAAERIGYPVIVKPRAAAASYGVALVGCPEEMAALFDFADTATVPHMPDYGQAVLVEEYLLGPEVSVDSAVVDGVVTPLFVARKRVGFAPYFEETGHVVAHDDPLLADPGFRALVQDTHTALGFTTGWTHAEFKLTADGPKVIEVNARLGGDLVPYLGLVASGIDPGLIAAAIACGATPPATATRELVAAVRFFYAEKDDTVIDRVEFDPTALPEETDSAVVLAEHGAVFSPPPRGLVSGRVAFATVAAPTAAECDAALDRVSAALRVVPLTATLAR